jgi:hypothetical protein
MRRVDPVMDTGKGGGDGGVAGSGSAVIRAMRHPGGAAPSGADGGVDARHGAAARILPVTRGPRSGEGSNRRARGAATCAETTGLSVYGALRRATHCGSPHRGPRGLVVASALGR